LRAKLDVPADARDVSPFCRSAFCCRHLEGIALSDESEPFLAPFAAPTAPFPACGGQCDLLAEANHRVANQFTVLIGHIQMSARAFRERAPSPLEFEWLLAGIEAKARAMATIHKLLSTQPSSLRAVDVSTVLHELCAAFRDQSGRGARLVADINGPLFLNPTTVLPVAQIVTEAILNALKYAYPDTALGEIRVSAGLRSPDEILVEVVDRGVGFQLTPEHLHRKGLGLRLMRGLANQADIKLSLASASPGLAVQLAISPAQV
jgi:two-component sensor histidine kinase